MKVATYEAIVEDGQIKLSEPVHLPERAKVYVVVPESGAPAAIHVRSPRLAQPERAMDFEKEVIEEAENDGVR